MAEEKPKYTVNGNGYTDERKLRDAMIESNDFRLVAYAQNEKAPDIQLIEALNAFGYNAEKLDD